MSENLTESENKLDALNRKKNMNSRKTLLPLFIYMIFRKESDEDHRLTGEDLIERLAQSPYNLTVERKSLARTLNLLADSDLGIVEPEKKGGGYYYSEIEALMTSSDDLDDIDDSYDIYDEEDMAELYDSAVEMIEKFDVDYITVSQIQRELGVRYDIAVTLFNQLKENGWFLYKEEGLYGLNHLRMNRWEQHITELSHQEISMLSFDNVSAYQKLGELVKLVKSDGQLCYFYARKYGYENWQIKGFVAKDMGKGYTLYINPEDEAWFEAKLNACEDLKELGRNVLLLHNWTMWL